MYFWTQRYFVLKNSEYSSFLRSKKRMKGPMDYFSSLFLVQIGDNSYYRSIFSLSWMNERGKFSDYLKFPSLASVKTFAKYQYGIMH
jgi:hypothetical protein